MVIIEHSNLLMLFCNFTGKTWNYYNESWFYKNNKFHRYYGPAYINKSGGKSWDFNGKEYGWSYDFYNQNKFMKDLKRSWLL